MKYFIITFPLIIFISCSHRIESKLDTIPITKHFTKSERKELAKIIDYTDSIILSNNKYSDIDKAYHYYFDSIGSLEIEAYDYKLAIDEEEKYSFLFNLDSTLFNKIWIKTITHSIVKTRDTTFYNPIHFVSININYKGEFVKMLEDFGEKNSYYQDLYSVITGFGDLPASYLYGFLYYNQKFDFNDIDNRLWASLFILTIEESIEMKVKRYLNK